MSSTSTWFLRCLGLAWALQALPVNVGRSLASENLPRQEGPPSVTGSHCARENPLAHVWPRLVVFMTGGHLPAIPDQGRGCVGSYGIVGPRT